MFAVQGLEYLSRMNLPEPIYILVNFYGEIKSPYLHTILVHLKNLLEKGEGWHSIKIKITPQKHLEFCLTVTIFRNSANLVSAFTLLAMSIFKMLFNFHTKLVDNILETFYAPLNSLKIFSPQ